MEIELVDFDPRSAGLLGPVAYLTLKCVRKRMPGPPPLGERPIKCFYRPNERGVPKMITVDAADGYSVTTADHYRIYLSAGNGFYGYFVFQLGHELGHLMFDPRRSNGVIETIACALSLQILKDVAKRWQEKPPLGHQAKNAYICRQYAKIAISDELTKSKAAADLAQWFGTGDLDKLAQYAADHAGAQDANMYDRLLNFVGAVPLVPLLPWADLVGIASYTVPSPDVDTADRELPLEMAALPQSIRTALRRIGR